MSTPPISPLTPAQEAAQEAIAAKENFAVRDLVAVDQCAGEVLFGAAPDETISTEAALASVEDHGFKKEVGTVVSKALDIFQHDHGASAAAGDEYRAEQEIKIVDQSGIR
jgi:hypothetical protein